MKRRRHEGGDGTAKRTDSSPQGERWVRSGHVYVEPDGTFVERLPSGAWRVVDEAGDDTRVVLWTRDLKEGETVDAKLVLREP